MSRVPSPPMALVRPRFRYEAAVVAALTLLIAWFYWWTMNSSNRLWKWGLQYDYYNLLVHGWLDGQLHLKAAVPDALLKLADPYDPVQRQGLGLHDATFYHGKYYIYFGVAPAAVLLLPFRLLTGTDLPSDVAVFVLVLGGFLASVAVWWQVRVRYFPAASMLACLTGVVLLALAGLGTVLLRRPSVYELAISGAYFFAMTALWCGFWVLHAKRRQVWWMAATSLAAGLAVGSRPSYVMGAPLAVLALMVWTWVNASERERANDGGEGRREGLPDRRRAKWHMMIAGVVPLGFCGFLLALHNYLRFGSPTEFGVRYMFSGFYEAKMTHFSPTYMGHNLRSYLLATPKLLEWFPFIESKGWPKGPEGYMAGDGYYGVLPTMPVFLLGPLALLFLWWRRKESEQRLRWWLTAVALLCAGVVALLSGFYSSAGRYQVDFAPALAMGGGVGLLVFGGLLSTVQGRGIRMAGRAALGVLVAWSLAFALMLSFQSNNEFRGHNPVAFRAIGAWFNVLPGWFESGRGAHFGPVELRVRFPEGRTAHREPLVTTGTPGRGDFFLVEYLDGGRLRFGFESWGSTTEWSEPLAIDSAKEHELRVVYATLVGPPILGHAEDKPERLRVTIDGRVAWEQEVSCYPSRAEEIFFGANPIGGTGCEGRFTGTVLTVKRGGKAVAGTGSVDGAGK